VIHKCKYQSNILQFIFYNKYCITIFASLLLKPIDDLTYDIKYGFSSWINNNYNNPPHDTFAIVFNNDILSHPFMKYINNIIIKNKPYLQLEYNHRRLNKCSSIQFLYTLFKLLLKLLKTIDISYIHFESSRYTFDIHDNDNIYTTLLLNTFSLFIIIHDGFNSLGIRYSKCNMPKYDTRLNLLHNIISSNYYIKSIYYISTLYDSLHLNLYSDFYELYIRNIDAIPDLTQHFKYYNPHVISILCNIINGTYTNDPSTRFKSVNILYNYCMSPSYVTSYSPIIIPHFIKYITTIKLNDICPDIILTQQYIYNIKIMRKLIYNTHLTIEYDTFNNILYKFISYASGILFSLKQTFDYIPSLSELTLVNKNIISFKYSPTVKLTLNYTHQLFSNIFAFIKYSKIEHLSNHSYSSIIHIFIELITLFKHNAMILFNQKYITLNIDKIQQCLIKFKTNFTFMTLMTPYNDIIKIFMSDTTHTSDTLADYYITSSIDIEHPDEFLDPILCTLIKLPVMLPDVHDLFFDKDTIITHLYENQNNPYTRKSLTITQLYEYNKLPNIIQQLTIFTNKLYEYNNSTRA
jgi:hypothetical protein